MRKHFRIATDARTSSSEPRFYGDYGAPARYARVLGRGRSSSPDYGQRQRVRRKLSMFLSSSFAGQG